MLKHTLKLIWNDVRRYVGLYIEQVIVFIVLLILMVSTVDAVKKYNEPGMLNSEGVITFGYLPGNTDKSTLDELYDKQLAINERLKMDENVIAISEGVHFIPYNRGDNNQFRDSISIGSNKLRTAIKMSDKYAPSVQRPVLIDGKWLSGKKCDDGSYEAVVTIDLTQEVGLRDPIGQKVIYKGNTFTIVGVMEGYKNSVFTPSVPAIIIPIIQPDKIQSMFSARVKDENSFILQLDKEWDNANIDPKINYYFVSFDEMKQLSMLEVKSNIVMMAVPTIFLVVFAFIGTFGLFWLNSQKRVKEFALRIATGSTKAQLFGLVICESFIISLVAMIPGVIIFFIAYEATSLELLALGITVVIMLMFAILSAWYPAYRISKINPAIAFNNE